MKLKNLLLIGAMLALLVASGGCIFSPDDGEDQNPTPTEELKDPISTKILMDNFEIIYEGMKIDEFTEMLHPAYRTILLQETMDEWAGSDSPFSESYLSRDEEIDIHKNIFGQNAGITPTGEVVNPVTSIDVSFIEQEGTWEPVEASDPDFGGYNGYFATYNVGIYFQTNGKRYDVFQTVEFYAAPFDHDGIEWWQLLGQRGKATQ